MTSPNEAALLQIGCKRLSSCVSKKESSTAGALVATRTGATNGSWLVSWKFFRSRA